MRLRTTTRPSNDYRVDSSIRKAGDARYSQQANENDQKHEQRSQMNERTQAEARSREMARQQLEVDEENERKTRFERDQKRGQKENELKRNQKEIEAKHIQKKPKADAKSTPNANAIAASKSDSTILYDYYQCLQAFLSDLPPVRLTFLKNITDKLIHNMQCYSLDVVKSCPSYFPPYDTRYWRNGGGKTKVLRISTRSGTASLYYPETQSYIEPSLGLKI
jgi:flagellar biosynthesis GTPase FlhF